MRKSARYYLKTVYNKLIFVNSRLINKAKYIEYYFTSFQLRNIATVSLVDYNSFF